MDLRLVQSLFLEFGFVSRSVPEKNIWLQVDSSSIDVKGSKEGKGSKATSVTIYIGSKLLAEVFSVSQKKYSVP